MYHSVREVQDDVKEFNRKVKARPVGDQPYISFGSVFGHEDGAHRWKISLNADKSNADMYFNLHEGELALYKTFIDFMMRDAFIRVGSVEAAYMATVLERS